MRLKLTLAYDGSAYSGWQIQARPQGPPTIQGAVETALFRISGLKIRIYGAGRTDAGVHALGQVCHCDVPNPERNWRARLNAVLPPDIRIVASEYADPHFHARKDALGKTYLYQFWTDPEFIPPQLRTCTWQCGAINLEAIRAGLQAFEGEHDFASFQNSGSEVRSTVRAITAITIDEFAQSDYLPGGHAFRLTISGSGFLKQMVRNVAGFLIWIGKGKLDWADLGPIMVQSSRSALPSPTAPAHGLTLAKVNYNGDH